MRAADVRRAVKEWAGMGFTVVVEPDGKITVTPPSAQEPKDAFDIVDMRRK
ncbi:hypothetical protein [Falsirhodobacter halotolerans]|uniref:hypothetical protein n=1 Tax=Falsirhodobacter halotolerans TaxID=1146892 RepID=UPI001FD068A0|nr:hypothetical protein [Falsirhodobacter halotolerans]MCJ8139599.1 hypothetical protein [Falsirhodobacter halotolerans]